MDRIIFILNGCDIYFVAEAPKDITLEQLLKQCDRIIPDYCACGIKSADPEVYGKDDVELLIDYDNIRINQECRVGPPSCTIKGVDE